MGQNIIIKPNKDGVAEQPKIDFVGADAGASGITLKVLGDSGLSFEGTAGQLFSINNNLSTGKIFSVNDISGIPSIDVDADGSVRFNPFNGIVYSSTIQSYGPISGTGAGRNLTLTAGSGVGVGKGGDIILQPGAQGSSGGNGGIRINSENGSNSFLLKSIGANHCTLQPGGTGSFFTIGNPGGVGYLTYGSGNGFGFNGDGSPFVGSTDNATEGSSMFCVGGSSSGPAFVVRRKAGTGIMQAWRAAAGTDVMGVARDGELYFPSSTTSIAANTDNLVLTGSAFQRINCTVASSITGIAPPTGGTHVDGRMGVRFYNTGTANLTFTHNSSLSASANRFFNVTGADIIIAPNDYAEGTYDLTSNGSGSAGWRLA